MERQSINARNNSPVILRCPSNQTRYRFLSYKSRGWEGAVLRQNKNNNRTPHHKAWLCCGCSFVEALLPRPQQNCIFHVPLLLGLPHILRPYQQPPPLPSLPPSVLPCFRASVLPCLLACLLPFFFNLGPAVFGFLRNTYSQRHGK